MKRLPVILFLFVLFSALSFVDAAESAVKVTLRFSKKTVDMGDKVQMTVSVMGGQSGAERPRIPEMPGFTTYYLGRSSAIKSVNGAEQNVTEFTFSLVPISPGKFRIPPILVEVGSDLYQTPSSEILVLGNAVSQSSAGPVQVATVPVPTRSTPSPAPSAPLPSQASPQSLTPPPAPAVVSGEGGEVFVRAYFDKPQVYVGEQVTMTYSIYFRTDTTLEGFNEEPVTTGFWTEEIPLGQGQEKKMTRVSGLKYLMTNFRTMALFPTRDGIYNLDTGSLKATVVEKPPGSNSVDDFFNDNFFRSGGFFAKKTPRILKANPLRLQVMALPEAGKPAGFNGAVGDFQMQVSLDKKVVKQNEPVVMTLVIEGTGNVETLDRPTIPEMAGVKMYESDSNAEVAPRGSVIGGRKTFKITIIPSRKGILTIPPVEFSFFNPRARNYYTQNSAPFQVNVEQGSMITPTFTDEEDEAGRKAKAEKENDIRFIREKFQTSLVLENEGPAERGLIVLAVLGTLGAFVAWRRFKKEEFFTHHTGLKRRLYAKRRAEKGIRHLQRSTKSRNLEKRKQFFAEANRVLSEYLADKFNISSQGLTLTEIEAQLAHFEIDPVWYVKIRDYYETTDSARFTASPVTGVESESLVATLEEVIKTLEKKIHS